MTANQLELHFLGDLRVVRNGTALKLPPSRKTRALLAYLAMNSRQFRREHLCELLWEIPDDPRGSLRWSLSKLRALVDTDDKPRIKADRSQVSFDASDTYIDVRALYQIADSELTQLSIEDLQNAASQFHEQFLEGLELTNFYGFFAWCVAERERVTRARSRILGALVKRLENTPEQALPHARSLVLELPYDESARACLIRLLVGTGRADEAEQQYQLGKRMLAEVGAESNGELFQAWRGAPGQQPAATPARAAPVSEAITIPLGLKGREQELDVLADSLGRVAAQRVARVVLISGAPGIGKSRLLQALGSLAQGEKAVVLRASAYEAESLRPFALWVDALQQMADGTQERLFSARDDSDRNRLLVSLSDCLNRAIEAQGRAPLVMSFDDVQWCDESSAAALGFVVRANCERPLMLVLAGRESELNDNTALQNTLRALRSGGLLQEIRLGPLSQQATREIIAEQAPDVDAEQLSSQCAGNPLLATELARAVAAGGRSASLDDMIRERIAHLDLQAVEVMRWAAVLSNRIELPNLVAVTGLEIDAVGDALVLLERQALLLPAEHGFRFSHDLVARSIYHDISPTRLRVMHRRVAQLLEKSTARDLTFAADLAHHAALSGDASLAARALVSAGRLCLRFFANREAISLANKGLQLAEGLGEAEQVCLALDFHDILLKAAPPQDWREAAAEYIALAEKALDFDAIDHARKGYYLASYLRWSHGHWTGAREESLQAERITRGGTELDQIVGMAEAAKCLAMLEQDLTRADAMLMEASALAQRRNVSVGAISAAGGMLRYHENQLDAAEELFKDARVQAKTSGDRINEFQANEYLVMIDIERDCFEAASERCRELLELGERLQEGSELPFARAMDGLCRYALSDERDHLDRALDDLRVADAKHRLAYIQTRASSLDIEHGRFEAALQRASEALKCAQILQRATETLLAHIALSRANQSLGNPVARQQHLAAIASLMEAPVAIWARNRAALLLVEQ